jgi:hypothetical protein
MMIRLKTIIIVIIIVVEEDIMEMQLIMVIA